MIMYLLDKQQNIIKAISDGILEAKMTEEINAADKLVFSLVQNMRLPSDIYYVCIPATRGDAFLMFKIISETVNDDRIEYTCIESAYDELKSYTYLKDVRPQDKTAGEMLNIALAGTRWQAGYVEETTHNQTNFYYISTLEALQKIVELFKVELTFSIILDPGRNRITRRQVNLYKQQGERTGKRFEYGSNLLSVTREESSENLVTALVGRGKGEQVSEGQDGGPDGYGRRIMFTDVVWSKANGNPTDKPAGQEYVEDKDATRLYGFDDGKPRIGIMTFEDIDDVNKLINATWAALQEAKRPKVSFKASALDVGDLGLGDTIAIIRHELNIEYFTRVYKVEHDLLDKNNNTIELGDDFSERSLTSYVSSVKAVQEQTTQIANIALTSANGKNKNFYSTTKPAIAAEGDNLFLDLGNGETEHYIWHNGNWELISSTAELDVVKKQVDEQQKGLEEARAAADSVIAKSNSAYEQALKGLEEAKKNADAVVGLKIDVKGAVDTANNVSKNYSSLREELLNSDKNNYDALLAEVNKTKQPIAELKTGLEGVNGKYASLDGRVGQFSAGLNGLTAQFNTSKEQLAQLKLNAQGLQAGLSDTNGNLTKLQAKANSIEQQMLGKVGNDLFESFKSSTAKELKEKLTATDLNGYVKTTELERTANGIHASVTAVEGKINNLNIGGRNYLQGTADFTWPGGIGENSSPKKSIENYTDNIKMLHISSDVYSGIYTKWGQAFPNEQLQVGDDYTFSFDAKGKGTIRVVKNESEGGNPLSGTSLTNEWQRFSVSGKINNLNKAFIIYFGGGYDAYIKCVKIEKGNKATDWSPAPEDIDNEFTTVNNTLKANKVTLDVLQNGISLNAAETTKINDKILNLGIQNLVYNSEFVNNAEGWSNIGNNPAGTILFANNEWDSWKGSNGLAFRNPSKQDYLVSDNKRFKVVSGQKLSASVQLHVTATMTKGDCRAGLEIKFYANETGPEISTSNQQTQFMYNIKNGQQKLLYCENVEVPNNVRYAGIRLYTFGVGNIIFNQPMCTFSEAKLPYIKDNQMVGTLQEKYASLNVKVDGINATVANKADRSYVDQEANRIRSLVSGKADTSYVDQRANQINSVVSGKADISLVNQKANEWQLQLAGLSIGGTNLLAHTSPDISNVAPPSSGYQEGAVFDTTSALNDVQYTLSFEARSDVNGQKIANYLRHGGKGGGNIVYGVIEANGTDRSNVSDGYWEVTLTNGWKKHYITYKVHPDSTKKTVIVGRRFKSDNTKGNVQIRKVKLEVGNRPTDWSPAPEDTLVAITAVRDDLTQAINLRVQQKDLLSQINIQAGHTLIQSNKIYLDSDSVVFSGKAFIPDAAITNINADKIRTGTLNAANVAVINLDVNRLTGNKTEFVRSSWRNAYGQYVNIDASGMRVTYGNTTTTFNTNGMNIRAVGENIGGIGWNGMVGMTDNYQGLLFWLDGGGDYMAWAARDNGNYRMNPQIKLGWYRNEWKPDNTNAGFVFDDDVTFNRYIYPSGNPSDGLGLNFFTTHYNGHAYPTIGSKSMRSGIVIGDWDLFFLFNDKIYPFGGWKIPHEIDGEGRVTRYVSV
ncbi:phage tail spike protein [Lactobacillus sp. AN1001]